MKIEVRVGRKWGHIIIVFVAALMLPFSRPLFAQDIIETGLIQPGAQVTDYQTDHFQWKSALSDAALYMGIEQGFRILDDPKIREGLRGSFFRDYANSVRNISGWSDGDSALTNYVGHPFSGSIVGYIQVRHDPRYRGVDFGWKADYWKSRMRAMAFTAAYSLEFEIGPVSEASLGNIQSDPHKRGVVDWVITPTVGTAWMVAEDFTDNYLIRVVERHTDNRILLGLTRTILNPTRSLSNLLGRRRPWQRDDRPGLNFYRDDGM
jgi:hypothetical protein